jgi:hypothetical protein
MDEGKKKILLAVIIVACIAVAGIVTIVTQRDTTGIDSIKPGAESVWLKCRDAKCENTWQMDKRAYFDYLEKHRMGTQRTPIPCPKCNGETGYRAEKCEKCGVIFERGSVPDAVDDKCPKCGFSKLESIKEAAGVTIKIVSGSETESSGAAE